MSDLQPDAKVVPGPWPTNGGGGSGPEGPDMEARIGRLEEDMRTLKATLGRLEPMIADMHRNMATRTEMNAIADRLSETREEMKEMKGEMKALLPTRTFVMWIVGLAVALFGMMLRLTGNL